MADEYIYVINQIMQTQGPEECREWFCISGSALHHWQSEIYSRGETVLLMHGPYSSYLECYATILWAKSKIHLTRQDTKTEAMNMTWDFSLQPAQLDELKKLLWPAPPEQSMPWF